MAFTFNGFGTKFYGEADRRPDGSFITTEWITAAYLPVIPLRSFRFVRVGGRDVNVGIYNSTSYAVLEKLPICWPQVGRVYAFMVGTALWVSLMAWLFFSKFDVTNGPNATVLTFVFVLTLVVPFVGVWWFRREAYKSRHSGSAEPPASA